LTARSNLLPTDVYVLAWPGQAETDKWWRRTPKYEISCLHQFSPDSPCS